MEIEVQCPVHGEFEKIEVPDSFRDLQGETLCNAPIDKALIRINLFEGKLISVERSDRPTYEWVHELQMEHDQLRKEFGRIFDSARKDPEREPGYVWVPERQLLEIMRREDEILVQLKEWWDEVERNPYAG